MNIAKQIEKADRLIKSKQNRENALALIGTDGSGNESFLQWITSTDKVASLNIPSNIKQVKAKAGTID